VDQPLTERRIDTRFILPHTSITRATLRPGCAVHVVDLSARGALVQAGQPLRPGARVHFQLVTTERAFALVGRILRCAVWTLDAERGATYRGALHFDERCEFSGDYEMLVPWKRDALHKSRSAAPGWQGAKSELIGHK
jgi:hypothetical protein